MALPALTMQARNTSQLATWPSFADSQSTNWMYERKGFDIVGCSCGV
jgi:hypothetical protein